MTEQPLSFDRITSAHVADVSPHGRIMSRRIRSIWEGARLVGPAYTVKVAPGDNASLMVAIAQANPGDVVVADGATFLDRALWGAIMSRAAQLRGIAGLVLDAAIRDRDEIREMGFPVFAVDWTPLGPYNKVSGHVGRPIRCGDIDVEPGDLVYADGDGVAVIPQADHAATLERVHDRMQREVSIVNGLVDGRPLAELLGILRSEAKP